MTCYLSIVVFIVVAIVIIINIIIIISSSSSSSSIAGLQVRGGCGDNSKIFVFLIFQ